jgi:putative membrane protein
MIGRVEPLLTPGDNNMKTMTMLTFAIALGAAAPVLAQAMSPADYVKTAGASDLYERQSSQLVLRTTSDPKVRNFAQMMLTAHAKSTAAVKAAAAQAHVKAAPPMLTPAQQEMIAQLEAEQGAARDAAYIAQQKAAHNQALSVQKAYAMGGTAAPLKAAAAGIVPVVEHHIMMLKGM